VAFSSLWLHWVLGIEPSANLPAVCLRLRFKELWQQRIEDLFFLFLRYYLQMTNKTLVSAGQFPPFVAYEYKLGG